MAAFESDRQPGERPQPATPPPNEPVLPAQPLPPLDSWSQAQSRPQPQSRPMRRGQPLPRAEALPQARPLPTADPLAQTASAQTTPPQAAIPQTQPLFDQWREAEAVPYPTVAPTAVATTAATAAAKISVASPPSFPQMPGATSQPLAEAAPVLVIGGVSAADPTETYGDRPGEDDLATIAARSAPPWLVSAVFHMVVLIALGLTWIANQPRNQIHLNVAATDEEAIYAEKLGEQLEFDSPLGQENVEAIEEPVLTPQNLIQVDDPFAAPLSAEAMPDGTMATSDIKAQIGYALNGREEGSKKSLLGRYGGTALTEEVVLRGLNWLAKNQNKDGSWSLVGPYRDGAMAENPPAATAMALLAFQGAGNTHKTGKFQKNVLLGWRWLLGQQDSDGCFFHEGPFNQRFYTQGQCTIAACELYGMSKDPEYKLAAERAVGYLLKSQSSEGGWRYSPQADSDVSVTGWIVMALQSARMAGLEVPDENFRRIERYLDSVAVDDGARYPYQRGKPPTLTMTAEALLCRQYLGWARSDARLVAGAQWITRPENLISYGRTRNVYYWYYATQVCHHMEGEYWKRWNNVMREALPKNQVARGREAGSWDPNLEDLYEVHGGRLYTTCLSIYMLEVYYRHLPLYTKIYNRLRQSDRNPATRSSADAPKPDAPKPDAPKPDAPKPDAPKPDAPKPDAPKTDAPKPDAPKTDAPKP